MSPPAGEPSSFLEATHIYVALHHHYSDIRVIQFDMHTPMTTPAQFNYR
jgi:hypothetical protein